MITTTSQVQLGENVVSFLLRIGDTEIAVQKRIAAISEDEFDMLVKQITKEIKKQLFK